MDIVSCYLVVSGDRAGPMMIDDAKVLGLSTLSTLIPRFFFPLIVSFCRCIRHLRTAYSVTSQLPEVESRLMNCLACSHLSIKKKIIIKRNIGLVMAQGHVQH